MAVLIGGCATVSVPSIGEQGYAIADDERRMHNRAEEMSEILDEGGRIYENEELGRYLTGLANKLLPETAKADDLVISVKVISEPTLNAFMLPNGRMYIHTGMLAAIENEAQLAALLCHEMIHAVNRHALKSFRSLTNKSALFSVILIPAAYAGGNVGSIFTQLAVVSSISGYSKHLENEADREGFALMVAEGYDVREAPKLFESLKQFIEEEEIKQRFFFSTHPGAVARIRSFNDLVAKFDFTGKTLKINDEEYRRATKELVLDNIVLCIHEGMFKTAQRLIEGFIERSPNSRQGYYYLGEIYRQRQDKRKKEKKRDKTQDYVKAVEAYNRSMEIDKEFARSFKGKARVLRKQGQIEEAKALFRQYLLLNPDAEDKNYINQFLSEK